MSAEDQVEEGLKKRRRTSNWALIFHSTHMMAQLVIESGGKEAEEEMEEKGVEGNKLIEWPKIHRQHTTGITQDSLGMR